MQTEKQSGLTRVIIVLLSLETFIALCEIALAVHYIMGDGGFIVSPSQPIQKTAVVLMTALYILILCLLVLCLLVFIKPKLADKRRLCSTALLIVEGTIVAYLLYMMLYNLVSNPDDPYFLLSLSWNIPRIIVSVSLLICMVIYRNRKGYLCAQNKQTAMLRDAR
jgi:hypothetical protein